jgi:predicted RNA-binding Zn ribbon-like protein
VSRSKSTESFRLGLGQPALEFVATLAARHRDPTERLAGAEDLDHWLTVTGLAPNAGCTSRQLAQARDLREAIYRLLEAARTAQPPASDDLGLVNEWARRSRPAPQLDATLRLAHHAANPCTAALAEIAASAIQLIGGPELPQIRNCADPTCSLMFIDRSRPGRRRWCSMERCGNRAKTAHYRSRRNAV